MLEPTFLGKQNHTDEDLIQSLSAHFGPSVPPLESYSRHGTLDTLTDIGTSPQCNVSPVSDAPVAH